MDFELLKSLWAHLKLFGYINTVKPLTRKKQVLFITPLKTNSGAQKDADYNGYLYKNRTR
ncbi:hypothetical protein BFP75_19820 [Maribacter sp. 4G9]|nr:hypothetical protein BFP75_19820 [Maribacter sp. 4G9]